MRERRRPERWFRFPREKEMTRHQRVIRNESQVNPWRTTSADRNILKRSSPATGVNPVAGSFRFPRGNRGKPWEAGRNQAGRNEGQVNPWRTSRADGSILKRSSPVTGVNPVAGSFLFRAGNGGNRGKPAGTKLDGTRDHPQHQEQEGTICAPGGMAIARKRNDQGATRLQQSWTE